MTIEQFRDTLRGTEKMLLDAWLKDRNYWVENNVRQAIEKEPNDNIKYEGNLKDFKFVEYGGIIKQSISFGSIGARKIIKRHKKRRINKKLNKKFGSKYISIKPFPNVFYDKNIEPCTNIEEVKLEKIGVRFGDYYLMVIETGRTNVLNKAKKIIYNKLYTQILAYNEVIWEDKNYV